jgi:predicted TIM-barrel fold metal-dependent hydrolase
MTINDAHCHFFSTSFFQALERQLGRAPSATAAKLTSELGWDDPGAVDMLADRWVAELDAAGVRRAALIASVPGDEASVAAAVARHKDRFVGFFMLDPGAPDAVERTRRALVEHALRGVCLFPAMSHVPLHDERTMLVVEEAARVAGTAVFVHCGALSVGVRQKLGLPSRFDLRLGDPLGVARLATAFPRTPFIIPHFGAGFFREALMAADAAPNIYFDTSSSNGWIRYTPGLTLETVFRTMLTSVGAKRLLFGTDSSFFPRGWQRQIHAQQMAIVEALAVGAADASLVFGGNFDRLFPARAAETTDTAPR